MNAQVISIKFTTSEIIQEPIQIIQKPSEKIQFKKYTISVEAHINAGNQITREIQVENFTTMADIKMQFTDVFFSLNLQPSYEQLVLICNNIALDNKFTISKLKRCLEIQENPQSKLKISLKIYWVKEIPPEINNRIVVVWIDPNFIENIQTYKIIAEKHKINDKMQMIQLASNEELIKWLNDNRTNLRFWYEMRRIFFISNMNRKPNYQNEGIQTLKIVRNRFEGQSFVFYIGDKSKCINLLKEKLSEVEIKNVHVFSTILELKEHFRKDFLNQLFVNQSFIHIPLEEEN